MHRADSGETVRRPLDEPALAPYQLCFLARETYLHCTLGDLSLSVPCTADTAPASTVQRLVAAFIQLEDLSQASAERMAATLGIGVRTLHRRLQEERASYRETFRQVRLQRCLSQLHGKCVSAKQVASKLGFADPSNFHRAFRRWTGQTFSEFQRAQRSLRVPTQRSAT